MTGVAIDVRGLRITYPDGTEAVRDVDLEISEGELFGFLGPNGAGKTTVIKTLVTLLGPTAGTVHVNGYDVTENPGAVRRSIGYMAQETSIDPELTARENIRHAARSYHVPREQQAARVDELLDLVDLADVADKPAKSYSGGMKKRLDAATALVHRPPLVFLDEPTTGLDPKARNRLWEYFRRINDDGTTIFLTTQYLEEADELCDRIAVIRSGEIVASGTPAELKREVGGDVLTIQLDDSTKGLDRAKSILTDAQHLQETDTIRTSESGLVITSARARQIGSHLLVTLANADVPVVGFDVRSPTLDDVFLALTGDDLESGAPSTDELEQATMSVDGGLEDEGIDP